jgi:hypothetical protein
MQGVANMLHGPQGPACLWNHGNAQIPFLTFPSVWAQLQGVTVPANVVLSDLLQRGKMFVA